MKTIFKLLATVAMNVLALWLSAKYIDGFSLTGSWTDIAIVAVVLILLNAILRPILKLIFSPFIILTLGLATLAVNAVILAILDFLSKNLTIEGIQTLVVATLLISAINFVSHLILK